MTNLTINEIKRPTINSSNMYIDVNGQGKGTLSGTDVDPDLVSAKVERLLSFKEKMTRDVNESSESNLFSAGQINAFPVEATILKTQVDPYVRQAFYSATCIPQITIYRVSIISGMYKITEKIVYSDCYILKCDSAQSSENPDLIHTDLTALDFSFRANQREETLYFFDQAGTPQGQNVTKINFSQGTLTSSTDGGGGGDAGGGADASGGGEAAAS